MTRDKEVVECLLHNNVTNRSQIKAGLRVAREHRLDPIIGLLLRTLGLDKEGHILNLGGFDLIEIKPSWIQPSLGLKFGQYRGHSRKHSSERIVNDIKRRSVTNGPITALLSTPNKTTAKSEQNESEAKIQMHRASKSLSVETLQPPASGISPRRKSFEAEDLYDARPKEAAANKVPPGQAPPIYDVDSLPMRLRKRASRPPGLSTVFGSPISETRSTSLPTIALDKVIVCSSLEEKFLGSIHNKDVVIDAQCRDVPDGDDTLNYNDEDRGEVTYLPQRRHVSYSKSITGSSCVAFSTMDKFKKQVSKQKYFVNFVTARDPRGEIISPKHIRKAAIKSSKSKDMYNNSGSMSPFASSDETNGSYQDLLASITTAPESMRQEFVSSIKSVSKQGSADEVDYGTLRPTTVTPSVVLIRSLDLSSNQLLGLDSLCKEDTRIPSRLRELVILDAKQNSLTDLPCPLFKVTTFCRCYRLFRIMFV